MCSTDGAGGGVLATDLSTPTSHYGTHPLSLLCTVQDYNVLMQAYARARSMEKVLEVFSQMQAGLFPQGFLRGCCGRSGNSFLLNV